MGWVGLGYLGEDRGSGDELRARVNERGGNYNA